jgi:hypothetical protein
MSGVSCVFGEKSVKVSYIKYVKSDRANMKFEMPPFLIKACKRNWTNSQTYMYVQTDWMCLSTNIKVAKAKSTRKEL